MKHDLRDKQNSEAQTEGRNDHHIISEVRGKYPGGSMGDIWEENRIKSMGLMILLKDRL